MRTLLRLPLVLAATALIAAFATPASAKGVVRVTVEGPALAQGVTRGVRAASTLASGTDLYQAMAACGTSNGCTHTRPHGDLGPRYTLTYTLMMPTRNGPEVRTHVVQYLYPAARPEALAYIPPGQHVVGWPVTRATWVPTEKDILSVAAGIEVQPVILHTSSPTPATTGDRGPAVASSAWDIEVLLLVALVALIVGLLVWMRRRHGAQPQLARR